MEGPNCPTNWTPIEFSPTGYKTNLNKGLLDADEIYIAFAAGNNKSPFGYIPKSK